MQGEEVGNETQLFEAPNASWGILGLLEVIHSGLRGRVYLVYVARFWKWLGCKGYPCQKRSETDSVSDTDSSKIHLSLSKAEPITGAHSASVTAF